MAFLLRRLVLSLLVPFLWRRWRERSAARRDSAVSEPSEQGWQTAGST